MILNRYQILSQLEKGTLENWIPENINSSSYDLRLGRYILVEELPEETRKTGLPAAVSLRNKDRLRMRQIDLAQQEVFILRPGQFILAESYEKFHMPMHLSAEYKLKSSMARIGLEHLNAGWIDAGFNNSVLTLEFRNLTTYHEIELSYLDRIGQIIFYQHDPVEFDDSYAVAGRYNGLDKVSAPISDIEKEMKTRKPIQKSLFTGSAEDGYNYANT